MEPPNDKNPGTPPTFDPMVPDNCTEQRAHPDRSPAATIEPCAIHTGKSVPIHLLACGHLVAIENPAGPPDNRCGLNCLHAARWMIQQQATFNSSAGFADYRTDTPFEKASTIPAPAQHATITPLLPIISPHQSHDTIFCETCQGLPASTYFVTPRELKRALALTRPVIEYFTALDSELITLQLCKPYFTPDQFGYVASPHMLQCGHQVWPQLPRVCAANCSDTTQCRTRALWGNSKLGDAILCHECVYRAELVYERYAQVEKASDNRPETCMPTRGVLIPQKPESVSQPQDESTNGDLVPDMSNSCEHLTTLGYPPFSPGP